MKVIELAYDNLDIEKKRFIFALIISLFFHVFLFFLLKIETEYRINLKQDLKKISEEVTVIFPENKPKQIVENVNENQKIPEKSDLLSERNSRAQNESLLELRKNQPSSDGNTPLANLSQPLSLTQNTFVKRSRSGEAEKFNRRAFLSDEGFQTQDDSQVDGFSNESRETHLRGGEGTNNLYDQKEFSADMLGGMTLSTYAWEWASYINYFKRKLYEVWRTPPAYYNLGLIHGYTVILLTIDRNGQKVSSQVLKHEGHSSLQVSSEDAVNDVFPLKPLPVDFPDNTLTLTLTLYYPNLRKRSN